MYITLERLIDGCIHTLRDDVMPEVGTRVARGQVWAVIDILQNMRNRIEEKAEIYEAESVSAEQALAQLVSALREAGAGSDAEALECARADAPANAATGTGSCKESFVGGACSGESFLHNNTADSPCKTICPSQTGKR